MKHPAIIRLIIVFFFFSFAGTDALAANYYHAKVTASVVNRNPTGTPVYGGTVMVQQYGNDQEDYSTSSTGGNYTESFIWEPSSGGNPVPITMKAKVDAGYNFSGWYNNAADDYPVSNNSTYTGSFNTGTEQGQGKAATYTIFAKFSPIPYKITYVKGDHSTGGSTTAKNYDIEQGFALASNGFAPEAGWVFDKWKVTTAGSGADGNWTLNSTYDEGESIAAGKYGDVTMTAQWKEAPHADIKISVTGLENGESTIFNVIKGGATLYTVALDSDNTQVTIKNLEIGSYTVTPAGWSWSYSLTPATATQNIAAPSTTFSFSASRNTSAKKHDEKSKVNWGKTTVTP